MQERGVSNNFKYQLIGALADLLKTSRPTISAWLNGIREPHPVVQQAVIKTLKAKTTKETNATRYTFADIAARPASECTPETQYVSAEDFDWYVEQARAIADCLAAANFELRRQLTTPKTSYLSLFYAEVEEDSE